MNPGLGVAPLTDSEFEQIRRLAHDRFGLDLKSGKREMVSARLGKKLRERAMGSFREYYEHVVRDTTGEALTELIDALTTNYTSFLREPAHFEFLRSLAPEFQRRGRADIWSAACATGEEPYSIAMSLREEFGGTPPTIHILATDISRKALHAARRAIYPKERFEHFPAAWLRRYFLEGQGRWRNFYMVKPEVRNLVEFRHLNLMDSLQQMPRFAVIFCRNVMIYFDRRTQEELVTRLSACLEPGGYLLTGHSESLMGSREALDYVRPAVYRRPRQ